MPWFVYPQGKNHTVPTGQDTEWGPELVWTWQREKISSWPMPRIKPWSTSPKLSYISFM